MLMLTRRVNEKIRIGDDIVIQFCGYHGSQIRLGITAPRDVPVHREEVWQAIQAGKPDTKAGVR